MEVFSELGLLDAELSKVNLCWLHRQVLTISDIADGSGERITMNAWKGTQSVPHTNRYKWGLNRDRRQHFGWYGNVQLHTYVDGTDSYFNRSDNGRGKCVNIGSGGMTSVQRPCSIIWMLVPLATWTNWHAIPDKRYGGSMSTQVPSEIPLSTTPCTVVSKGTFSCSKAQHPCIMR
jgi:hypothetical protein